VTTDSNTSTLDYAAVKPNDNGAYSVRNILSYVFALGVAGFFIYAAYGKIGPVNARQFAVQIGNYKILDAAYSNVPAIILPFVEVYAAIALLFPKTRKAGAILIAGMLLFFICAVFYSAIHLGLSIDCGCTGKGGSKAGWGVIARNTGLLIATGLSVWLYRCEPCEKTSTTA